MDLKCWGDNIWNLFLGCHIFLFKELSFVDVRRSSPVRFRPVWVRYGIRYGTVRYSCRLCIVRKFIIEKQAATVKDSNERRRRPQPLVSSGRPSAAMETFLDDFRSLFQSVTFGWPRPLNFDFLTAETRLLFRPSFREKNGCCWNWIDFSCTRGLCCNRCHILMH